MVEILSWAEICALAEDFDRGFRFPAAEVIVPLNPHR